MTKKDYELIAGAIYRSVRVTQWTNKNRVKREAELKALRLVATDLASSLAHENPKFDRKRFIEACGIGD